MSKTSIKRVKKVAVPRSIDWAKAVKQSLVLGKQQDLIKIYYHINTAAILLKGFLPK